MNTALLISTILIASVIIWADLRDRKDQPSRSLTAFAVALTAWAAAFNLFTLGVGPGSMFWLSTIFLCATLTATALLTFIFGYTNRGQWLTTRTLVFLAFEPILTQVLFWTNSRHGLFFSSSTVGATATDLVVGPWYWVNSTYCDALIIFGVILLTQTFPHKPRRYLLQSSLIIAAAFVPLAVKILGLSLQAPNIDLLPLGFAISGLILTYDLFRFRPLEVVPIARDGVVESMNEGWMVLDLRNRIVDVNPAAEALLGLPREKLFGQPAENFLKNWPNLSHATALRELEIKGSINLRGEWRYLNVRISPIANSAGARMGEVILWRDITERRKSDDARQRARDEMFVLLRAISGAASRNLSMNDFLAESIYQIVYSFHSQASAIVLMEDSSPHIGRTRYSLAVYHGIPVERINKLSSMPESAEIVEQVVEAREPLTIPGGEQGDLRLSSIFGHRCVLVVPMTFEEKVLGIIYLAREDGAPYSPDEISRLSVVAEEVASLIYSDRQRQIAIALEERQRLVRDLHDSVTQKLYGLVALTEAAQASAEAGTAMQPSEVLARIGENARQALKEMRLFLFEMKPVDVEREGIVAVLHQRLAAVEGRADIKARLIADEDDINLSLEKQVALYYIAQEALNNVLKHANATSVKVCLGKKRNGYVLEVEDDGCGFKPEAAERGGMGLRNMKERCAKVGGRLKIASTPKKGTRITVTVAKDKFSGINRTQENP
jgi:PAS domain S-box-containing protein